MGQELYKTKEANIQTNKCRPSNYEQAITIVHDKEKEILQNKVSYRYCLHDAIDRYRLQHTMISFVIHPSP